MSARPLTPAEARDVMRATLPRLPLGSAPLAEGDGRFLIESVVADADQPPFDRSAMDGYAVADDDALHYSVSDVIPAGSPSARPLARGTCARVFTGAPVPPNAVRVIKQEDVRIEGDRVTPLRRETAHHLRRRGEDCRSGDLLLPAGTRLDPARLALCAGTGLARLPVTRRARVALVTTGDELVGPEDVPGPGQIRDVNQILLASAVTRAGASLAACDRLRDGAADLRSWVDRQTGAGADLLLLSGGASVGDHDHVRSVLTAAGFRLAFTRLALRPGAPFLFASRDGVAACGIPGNPVSHIACLALLVIPLLDHLHGGPGGDPSSPGRMAAEFRADPNPRETWWPAAGTPGALTLLSWNGSGHLAAFAAATHLVQIPANTPHLPAGEPIRCVPLP